MDMTSIIKEAKGHPGWAISVMRFDMNNELTVTYDPKETQLTDGTGTGEFDQLYFSLLSHGTEVWSCTV